MEPRRRADAKSARPEHRRKRGSPTKRKDSGASDERARICRNRAARRRARRGRPLPRAGASRAPPARRRADRRGIQAHRAFTACRRPSLSLRARRLAYAARDGEAPPIGDVPSGSAASAQSLLIHRARRRLRARHDASRRQSYCRPRDREAPRARRRRHPSARRRRRIGSDWPSTCARSFGAHARQRRELSRTAPRARRDRSLPACARVALPRDAAPHAPPIDSVYLLKILDEEIAPTVLASAPPDGRARLNGVDSYGPDATSPRVVDVALGTAQVEVRDNGAGMSLLAILSRLLIPFATDKRPGIDLGRFGVGFFSVLGYGVLESGELRARGLDRRRSDGPHDSRRRRGP